MVRVGKWGRGAEIYKADELMGCGYDYVFFRVQKEVLYMLIDYGIHGVCAFILIGRVKPHCSSLDEKKNFMSSRQY